MQYAPVILLISLAGISFSQEWNIENIGKIEQGDEHPNIHRFLASKRAINGQLRRSSIRWGKRDFVDVEQQLIPDDVMALWPAPRFSVIPEKKTRGETLMAPSTKTASQTENSLMERVAKGGIRPKLALSSRLWGR